MITKTSKNATRLKRHARVRAKLSGTAERPRLNVFRSNKNIYAQVIDDVNGVTLVSASTLDKELKIENSSDAAAVLLKLANLLQNVLLKKESLTWYLTAEDTYIMDV
nr:50S ribosomal protein L18 [Bacillus pumilus]